ncbi:MAG TPA: WecB/TagA/CpsF family glycosyltransferase [Candidatus Binatia bacterium]|nr:WecB/TagA/CpsF family glycosyltransferase [Candidatus Binatia bacterium]
MKIDIAGVNVDNVTVKETLDIIDGYVRTDRPHYIVTTYSEFIVEAAKNSKFKEVLNKADLSVPDGIGILWAAKFLSMPKRDPVITTINWLGSLSSILLAPQSLRSVIKEQVTGSRLIWDIARLAQDNNYSLALYGGEQNAAEKTKEKLLQKYPNLRINLAVSDKPFDQEAVQSIRASNSDILLIAYQPPKQEIWIADNLQSLNVKAAIGLGGTFDYISGKRKISPDWISYIGLEWLWRLVTQPWRWKRMWNAIIVFSCKVLSFKLKQ